MNLSVAICNAASALATLCIKTSWQGGSRMRMWGNVPRLNNVNLEPKFQEVTDIEQRQKYEHRTESTLSTISALASL